MATLTETAYYTRKGVKIFIAAIIGIVVLKILYGVGVQIWLAWFPPPPPPATMAFGLLPKIKFPKTNISTMSARFTYHLETVDGKLPAFPQNLRVYFIPKPGSSFGKDERMTAQAAQLGFLETPEKIFGTTDSWRFNDPVLPLRHLEYDATTNHFKVFYDYRFDLNLFSDKSFASQAEIEIQARDFFDELGLEYPDLATGSVKTRYFKLATTTLVPTTSLFEADAVLVNLNRAAIVEGKLIFPVVGADPNKTNVSVLFSGSLDKSKKILEANFNYSVVDYENYATYPSLSAQAAYEMLGRGQAFVASVPAGNPRTIAVRRVEIGYYDDPEVQNYLQPVVIFSDGKGFTAYVPAVSPSLFAP